MKRAGRWRLYLYAWRGRGAPLLFSAVADTRAELAGLEREAAAAIAERYALAVTPRAVKGTVAALVADFRASTAWTREFAASTKRLWGPHLDAIEDVFGPTSLAAIQRKGARKLIRDWHAGMDASPRKANTALTVLVRVFNHGLDIEEMERNPAEGLARHDEGAGRADVVWTPEEHAQLIACCRPALARAMRLAWETGLRREDLIRLTWSEVDLEAGLIRRRTLKSRRRPRTARVPITAELGALLDAMREAAPDSITVVTTEAGRPYASPRSFSRTLERAMRRADVRDAEGELKHLHDMRGSRATRLFAAGASDAEAEAFFGWAPGQGAKMREIYADPETIAKALARRLHLIAG